MNENPLIIKASADKHNDCCKNNYCLICESHVSGYNCNKDLINERPEASSWDWWMACDNANCVHSYGEGVFQDKLNWIFNK